MALAKGGISAEHCLLLPISHYTSLAFMHDEVEAEFNKYLSNLKTWLKTLGQELVIFERNMATRLSHAHLQIVPMPIEYAKHAKEIFIAEAKKQSAKFIELPLDNKLRDVVQPGEQYFYVELSYSRLLYIIPEGQKFSLQFGREVVCAILNLPDRIDWKQCQLQSSQELQLATQFRNMFKEYDTVMYLKH